MGDFNPNTPTIQGSEVFPTFSRTVDIGANPLSGIAMRMNPGNITPGFFGIYEKANKNSLHMCELVSTLAPTLTAETVFPGTNTGKVAGAGWVTETGGANDFGKVNKNNDDTSYLTLTGLTGDSATHTAVGKGYNNAANFGGCTPLLYRGNRATTYLTDGARVVSVTINVRIASTYSPNIFQFALEGFGGSTANVFLSGSFKPPADGVFRTYSFTVPADPWAMATVNAAVPFWNAPAYSKVWGDYVTTGGSYAWGIAPIDTTGGGGGTSQFKVSGLWLTVNYATENRLVGAYPRATLVAGWNKLPTLHPNQRQIIFTSNSGTTALTTPAGGSNGAGDFTAQDVGAKIIRASDGQVVGTINTVTNSTTAVLVANGASTNAAVLGYLGTQVAALSAATYYYAVHGQTAWATKSTIPIEVIQDTGLTVQTSASATGEHRSCYNLTMTNSGSMVAAVATQTTGELIPTLLYDSANAVKSQSQPYTTLAYTQQQIFSGTGGGQQITTAAATTYSAVKVAIARWSQTKDPDQPLSVEIRHGAGAATGGGTLDATATIYPAQLIGTNRMPTVLVAAFSATFVSILNTQYVVYFRSSSTSGRGWAVSVLNCHDDTVTGVTSANLAAASIGTSTDAFLFNAGTASGTLTLDSPAALCAQPTTPSGLATTIKVAT